MVPVTFDIISWCNVNRLLAFGSDALIEPYEKQSIIVVQKAIEVHHKEREKCSSGIAKRVIKSGEEKEKENTAIPKIH